MTIETFRPLSHKWKTERRFVSGTHPVRIQKTCTVCTVSGGKSKLEHVGPCPGVPHTEECLRSLDYMRCGTFFLCECGRNKGHRDKVQAKQVIHSFGGRP